MNELIKAIELIKAEINDFETNFMCDKDDSHDIGFVAGLHRAKSLVRSLQSTNVAPDWIPCSERLPEYMKTVIISTFWGVKMGYLDSTEAYGDFWEIIEEDGDTALHNVYAWMPLPKPYREDGEV